MYFEIVNQCAEQLERVLGFLKHAETHAAAKNIEPEIFLFERLVPDMYPLVSQIQAACDYAEGGVANLSGRRPPRHSNDWHTIEQVRTQLRTTIDFMRSIDEAEFKNSAGKSVRLPWKAAPIPAEVYLLQIVFANVYFHSGMVYSILRQGGVDVGKESFLGDVYRPDA